MSSTRAEGYSGSHSVLTSSPKLARDPLLQARPRAGGPAAWAVAALVRGRAQSLMPLGVSLYLPSLRDSEGPSRQSEGDSAEAQPVWFWTQVADFLFKLNSEV